MNTFIGAPLPDVTVAGRGKLLYASSASLPPLLGIFVLLWVPHSVKYIYPVRTVLQALILLGRKESKKGAPRHENEALGLIY